MCNSVQLVEAPFAYADVPSLAIGLLKAVAEAHGVPCRCHYVNLAVFNALGREDTTYLSGEPCLGNYVVAQWLYPDDADVIQGRLNEHLARLRPSLELGKKLPDMAGRLRRVIDDNLDRIIREGQGTRIIGFSVSYAQLLMSLYLARELKRRVPDLTIVFGGPLAGIEAVGLSLLKCFPQIDIVAFGEGEETLLEIVAARRGQRSMASVQSIAFRHNGTVTATPRRPVLADLDCLPIPDHTDYLRDVPCSAWQSVLVPIQMSRGCSWNRCSFCENPGSWGKHRTRSAPHVLREILAINEQHRLFTFYFVDQELTGAGESLGELCRLLGEAGRGLGFFAHVRAPALSKPLLAQMKHAGFVSMLPGIESFSTPLLQKMRKGTTAMDNVAALKYAAELGIRMQYNLISCFPGENEDDVRRNLDTLRRLRHFEQWARISGFLLQRGSHVYRHQEKYQVALRDPLDFWAGCFPAHVQDQLAFTAFDFSPRGNTACAAVWKEIAQEMSSRKRYHFFYLDAGTHLVVVDTRSDQMRETELSPLESRIVRFCSVRRTLAEIRAALHDVAPVELEHALTELTAEGLLFAEGDEYLCLMLPGNGETLQGFVVSRSLL